MLTNPPFHRAGGLWKTPVEKLVENVEKFCFSTAIPETAHCGRGDFPGPKPEEAVFGPPFFRVM